MIVSFYNGMVIGDSSSQRTSFGVARRVNRFAEARRKFAGNLWSTSPDDETSDEKRNEWTWQKEEYEGTGRKWKGEGRVCFYATCSAKPDSSFLSERHNYAVIARSFFI